MIDGFKVDVKSDELKTRFLAKMEECKGKEKELMLKSEKLKDGINEVLDDEPEFSVANTVVSQQSRRKELASLAKTYRMGVDLYSFLAAHLVEGEVYRLGRDELSLLFTDGMPMGHIGAVLGRY